MEQGGYLEIGGRPAVRFVRVYPHPVDRVWSAVSDPEELRRWFPSNVRPELSVGGKVTFSGDPNAGDPEEDVVGTVLVCDPPRRLGFTWGGDEVHFELEPVGPDSCRFTLTNVLEARNAAARNAAGWSVCVGELDKHMRGELAEGPHSSSAGQWQPLYDAYVRSGMPSGAQIPGS